MKACISTLQNYKVKVFCLLMGEYLMPEENWFVRPQAVVIQMPLTPQDQCLRNLNFVGSPQWL